MVHIIDRILDLSTQVRETGLAKTLLRAPKIYEALNLSCVIEAHSELYVASLS